ncbi:unnamed protein product, partial [Mesorhabditis spiculigera]
MMPRIAATLLLLLLKFGPSLADVIRADDGKSVTVDTPRGQVTGFHSDLGHDTTALFYGNGDVFLGIPYAEPPIGEKRFQKPVPLCSYPQNPYDATAYKHTCVQPGDCVINATQSEDCLYLNVFTPNAASIYKYPVMVWIHGGSMTSGCAQEFDYKGAIRNLVERGVVVVTLQYRLGLIGFFTTFTDEFPPNRGMLDQVEAIRWVTDNIQYFGGNPYRITLFGESAGGASVSAHTYSPLSQNLFQQAIMQSGVALTSFEGSLGFSGLSEDRAASLCNFTDDQWQNNQWQGLKDCLLSKTIEEINTVEVSNPLGWKICQDNYFMPGVPRDLASARPNIPVMIGTMRDEFAAYLLTFIRVGILNPSFIGKLAFEFLFDMFANFLATREADVMAILERIYSAPGVGNFDHAAWFKTSSDVFTAAGFTGFVIREANNYVANGNKQVYLYEQTFAPNVATDWGNITDILDYKPVGHTAELAYLWIFEQKWKDSLARNVVTPFDYQLADWYGETWTTFAKYGMPILSNAWTPVKTRDDNDYFRIDDPTVGGMTMQQKYRYTDDISWTRVIPALAGDYPPIKPDYNNGTNPLPTSSAMRRERYSPYFEPLQR